MADLMSILSTAYKSNVLSNASGSSKYVPVDSTLYQGSWTGNGFRAQIHYESAGTSQFQQVLIKDSSFRFGNTRFTLTAVGKAQIKNVVTNAATGSTYLDTAQATLDA
jgi:hypothetical protein